MNKKFSKLPALIFWLALPCSAFSQDSVEAAPRHDLHILLVTDTKTNRAVSYSEFLRQRFARVETADLASFDPEKANHADVVLMDWPQSQGQRKMVKAFRETNEGSSPLGRFNAWKIPTVFVGSAGHNMAAVWGIRGGSG